MKFGRVTRQSLFAGLIIYKLNFIDEDAIT
jgi:hypothetical protein